MVKLKATCVGELDAGSCSPIIVRKFSELIEADQVQIMPNQGHQLDRSIVRLAISEFLVNRGEANNDSGN